MKNKECIVIQIGNSDDKLTQKEWSQYAGVVASLVEFYAREIHFSGASLPACEYQNACWIMDVWKRERDDIFDDLKKIAEEFKQDSIAVMVGQTEFLESAAHETEKGA